MDFSPLLSKNTNLRVLVCKKTLLKFFWRILLSFSFLFNIKAIFQLNRWTKQFCFFIYMSWVLAIQKKESNLFLRQSKAKTFSARRQVMISSDSLKWEKKNSIGSPLCDANRTHFVVPRNKPNWKKRAKKRCFFRLLEPYTV